MAVVSVTHAKVVSIPDDPNYPVGSDEWNAAHTITGLENVDNTSDVNKPVSTAQAAADAAVAAAAANASNLASGTVPAARMPALTGDVTTPAGSVATTLATVNPNVGSFGSATQTVQVTLNAKGLATAASSVTVTPAIGSVTGLGTGVATFLATPSSANLRSALTDESGSGSAYFQGGDIGTPSAGVLTNATGLPPLTGLVGGSGVWTNQRQAKTAAYTVTSTDAGSTIALGGAAFYVVTLPNPAGLNANFMVNILNEDDGRGKQILPYWKPSTSSITIGTGNKDFTVSTTLNVGGFTRYRAYSAANPANFMSGRVNLTTSTNVRINVDTIGGSGTFTDWVICPEYMLWPNQSDFFYCQNGVWKYHKRRWKMPLNNTLYIDPVNGIDANDGLAPGSGAMKTAIQASRFTAKDEFEITGISSFSSGSLTGNIGLIFQLADNASGGNVTTTAYSGFHMAFGLLGGEGRARVVVRGNTTTPSNVVIADSGASCIGTFGADVNIELDSLQLGQTNPANSPLANSGIQAADSSKIRLARGVIFGACSVGQLMSLSGGIIVADSAISVVAGAQYFAYATDPGSAVNLSSQTVTFSNSPAYSGQFAAAFEAAVVNVIATTWTNGGTVTGTSYFARNLAGIFTNGVTLPGTGTGTTDGSGKVG